MLQLLQAFLNLLPIHFNKYRTIIEQQPARYLRQNMIHPPFIRMAYPECAPLFQLIKLLNKLKTDKHDTIFRHEIFPDFSGLPEFSRPQRSFSWKSQIRFNIYGGGGYHKLCVLAGRLYYPHCQLILNAESSQVSGVGLCTTSTCTSIT